MTGRTSKFISPILRLAVTALVLVIVLRQVELRSVADAFRNVAVGYLPWVALLIVFCRALVALRWRMLLQQGGVEVGLFTIVRIIFMCDFYAMVLPSGGGDVLRVLYMKGERRSATTTTASIIAERLMGVVLMATMSAIAVVFIGRTLPDPHVPKVILGVSALVWVGVIVILSRRPFAALHRVGKRLVASMPSPGLNRVGAKLLAKLDKMHLSLQRMISHPAIVLYLVMFGLLIVATRIASVEILFRSLGTPVPLAYIVAFMPMIFILVLLPISVYGLGVQEAAFVYFYSLVGVDPAVAVGVSLMAFAAQFAVTGAAAFLFTFVGAPRRGLSATKEPPPQPEASATDR